MHYTTYTFPKGDTQLKEQLQEFPEEFCQSIDALTERIFDEYQWYSHEVDDLKDQAKETQDAYRHELTQYRKERKNILLSQEERAARENTIAQMRQQYLRIRKQLLNYIWEQDQENK